MCPVMEGLKDKVFIVTGGGSGIGAATVRRVRQKSLKERLVIIGRLREHDLATVEEMCDRVIVLAW